MNSQEYRCWEIMTEIQMIRTQEGEEENNGAQKQFKVMMDNIS